MKFKKATPKAIKHVTKKSTDTSKTLLGKSGTLSKYLFSGDLSKLSATYAQSTSYADGSIIITELNIVGASLTVTENKLLKEALLTLEKKHKIQVQKYTLS